MNNDSQINGRLMQSYQRETQKTGNSLSEPIGTPISRGFKRYVMAGLQWLAMKGGGRERFEITVEELIQVLQGTLDGLSAHIAVLNADGLILAVNAAWRQFANDNPPFMTNVLEGADYLAVCDAAQGPDAAEAAAFATGLRAVLAGERPFFQLEYPCHSPDEKRWFIGRVTRFPDDNSPARAIVAHENITGRKLAEDDLRKFKRSAEQSPISILFTDKNGVIEYVNPKMTELTGYASDELLGQNPRLFKSGHTADAEYQQLWETITNGKTWQGEFLNRKKDGTLFWESATISPLKNATDHITNFVALKKDITQEKKAAAILTESRQRYKALFENASDAIFVTDLNGRFLDANHVARQRLGYSLEEFREMTLESIDPIDFSRLQPVRMNPLQNGAYAYFETVHVSRDGQVIPTEVSVQYIEYGEQKAILSIARDITERRKSLRVERESRRFAEALADTAAIINNSLSINQILNQILKNVGKIVSHEMATIMFVDGEYAEVIDVKDAYDSSVPHAIKGMRIKIADFGTLTTMIETQEPLALPFVAQYANWVNMPAFEKISSYVGAPICEDGSVIGFINLSSRHSKIYNAEDAIRLRTFADHAAIAMKNARLFTNLENMNVDLEGQVGLRIEEVRHEKERLESVLYYSADNILLLNVDGTIEMANPKFMETFGLGESDVVGCALSTVLPIKEKAALINYLRSVTDESDPVSTGLEVIAELKDGSSIDVEIRLAPIKNGVISGVVCNIRNTTPFKAAERAKDTFVSNVSHELKTPITSIGLYHQLLRVNPDKQELYLSRLDRETNRLNQLLEDLLCLSRLDQNRLTLNLTRFDLNRLVTNLVEDRQLVAAGHDLSLKIENMSQLPHVTADAGLIEQVISILLTNAINYTTLKGQITVSAYSRCKGDVDWCGVSISDTGPGIVLDEQSKIFERFYRGKTGITSEAPGTGLGLAIAAEIIAHHQGEIELQSDGIPGKGSTFTIWLPVHIELMRGSDSPQLAARRIPIPALDTSSACSGVVH